MTEEDQRLALERKVSEFIRDGLGSFEHLAIEVYDFQRRFCVPYGAFCEGGKAPESWREIPAIPLTAFRQASIRCFPAAATGRTFRTSGTTGEGYGEHHFSSLSLYREAALKGWEFAGLSAKRVVCLLPYPDKAPYSSLSQMGAWLAPRDRFFFGDWEGVVAALDVDETTVLFGTALAFLDFFEWLGERRVELPRGSVAVETGGYKGSRRDMSKAELLALFNERLGLEAGGVFNEYGMTELSSQFYSRGLRQAHRGGAWVRALVVSPESGREAGEGETGVLRIFDLANVGSCCAIQTRDLAIRRGADFELIGRDPAALPRGCSRAAEEWLA